jgi:hypothetical protein
MKMRRVLHWSLFGISLAQALVLCVAILWRLQTAFTAGALTRDLHLEALVLLAGVFASLLSAGWALASRPGRPQPVQMPDSSLWI